jgi:hypothetical protein
LFRFIPFFKKNANALVKTSVYPDASVSEPWHQTKWANRCVPQCYLPFSLLSAVLCKRNQLSH